MSLQSSKKWAIYVTTTIWSKYILMQLISWVRDVLLANNFKPKIGYY